MKENLLLQTRSSLFISWCSTTEHMLGGRVTVISHSWRLVWSLTNTILFSYTGYCISDLKCILISCPKKFLTFFNGRSTKLTRGEVKECLVSSPKFPKTPKPSRKHPGGKTATFSYFTSACTLNQGDSEHKFKTPELKPHTVTYLQSLYSLYFTGRSKSWTNPTSAPPL